MTNHLTSGLRPTHPGELLREDVLPALGLSKTEMADALRVPHQTLSDVLDETKPITPQMALRLGKLLGNGAAVWLRLQVTYDLATMRVIMADELELIPTLEEKSPDDRAGNGVLRREPNSEMGARYGL